MRAGRSRLSPSMAVALLALAVALSAPAYAAVSQLVPRGSVGTAQLRNNAVTSAKIKNGAVALADLAKSARVRGPVGPKGDTGPAGPTGPPGPKGAPGLTNVEVVTDARILQSNQVQGFYDTRCPTGKTLIGGGVATFNREIQIMASTPLGDVPGGRWSVTVRTFDNQPVGVDSSVNIRIVCANVSSG